MTEKPNFLNSNRVARDAALSSTETKWPPDDHRGRHYHFVTGRLAESAVRREAAQMAGRYGFDYSVDVLPITVAALLTTRYIRRHLTVPDAATHVVLPGYCDADDPFFASIDADVLIGPKDCRRLGAWFGGAETPIDLSEHAIEIIAEINHAPDMSIDDAVAMAGRHIADGADRIDVGARPGRPTSRIGDYVAAIADLGTAVSIDSFDADEVAAAIDAGADLVLSVNSSNIDFARRYTGASAVEFVAIPDTPRDADSLDRTIESLDAANVRYRIDPILEPIGAGLGDSIVRYGRVRSAYPDAKMMMGIGNLTELTDVDSAGINFLLLGVCGEWRIESVLTTQVINWARTSIRECDLARRMVHHSVTHRVPPKRLSDALIQLRDDRCLIPDPVVLDDLSATIRDNNYRIFALADTLRILSADIDLSNPDPFELFDQLMRQPAADNIDPAHAFYLGFELCKAMTAMHLGKTYTQDEALRWGHLTVPEDHRRIKRTSRHRRQSQ